ncbi:MAG: PAS domain-containing sensor histidine kinase [Chloroflexi bacterium]|nr:MAG: PAS domain-containing sensor histidine kinase [Chloroflexota bacterium]
MAQNSYHKNKYSYRSGKVEQLMQKLTEPARQVELIENRYQARFLASLLLAFIIFAVLSIVIQLLTVPGFEEIFPSLGIGLLILIGAYFLSRTRHFKWGIIFAIAIPSIAVFVNLVLVPSSIPSVVFLLISILLSSVLLQWRWTLFLVGVDILVLVLLILFLPALSFIQLSASMFFIFIASGLIMVTIRYRDILEESRQAELTKNEKRYRKLISQSPFSTVVYSPDGRPLFYNKSAIELWDVSEQDVAFIKDHYNILQDQQLEEKGVLAFVRKGFSGQEAVAPPSQYIFERVGENGRIVTDERWIVAHCYPILDDDQQILEVVLIHEDITERLESAEKLEQRNRELTLLNRVISVAASTLKRDDILRFVGREMASVFEVSHAISALFNEDNSEIVITSAVMPAGTPDIVGRSVSIRPFSQLPISEFLIDQNSHLNIEDVQTFTHLAPVHDWLAQLKIRSLLIVPLILRKTLIGIIALATEHTYLFDSAQIKLAASVASSVSQALQNAQLYEEVQQHSAKLEARVAQRTVDLEDANQKLQALAMAKDEFIANVSHELRTPIGNIKLYHDLLTINPQKRDTYLATLHRETGRLEHIVESLLHLSRLDQGSIPLKLTSVNINAIAEIHVTDRILKAQSKHIELVFQGEPNLPNIDGDMMQLGQVLGILLTNALNYSSGGGKVVVRTTLMVKDDQPWVTCSVSDSGPGISAADMPKLFNRFFRGEVGQCSETPGTGLGLSIAKTIVDRHHGYIKVESDGIPGNGTTMTIWLPVKNSSYGG